MRDLVILAYLHDKIEDVIDADNDLFGISVLKNLKADTEGMKIKVDMFDATYDINLKRLYPGDELNNEENYDDIMITGYLMERINTIIEYEKDANITLTGYIKCKNGNLSIEDNWLNTYQIEIEYK